MGLKLVNQQSGAVEKELPLSERYVRLLRSLHDL